MAEYNAGERRHVKLAARAAKTIESQRREVVVGLMSSSAGREWVHHLLTETNVFVTSHTGNALNTAFNEGKRNVGLMLLGDITSFCTEDFITMMREEHVRRSTADINRGPDSPDGSGPDLFDVVPDPSRPGGFTERRSSESVERADESGAEA